MKVVLPQGIVHGIAESSVDDETNLFLDTTRYLDVILPAEYLPANATVYLGISLLRELPLVSDPLHPSYTDLLDHSLTVLLEVIMAILENPFYRVDGCSPPIPQ